MSDAQPPAEETKRCPFCGEEILAVAVVCKHCGRDLKVQEEKKGGTSPVVFLILIIVAIAVAVCLLSGQGGSSTSSTLNCTSERSTIGGETGLTLGVSKNVNATVKSSSGSTVAPDMNDVSGNTNGQVYMVRPGSYKVEIRDSRGNTLQTYDETVHSGSVTLLVVVCK